MYSAKELEHYDRVRKTFDSPGESNSNEVELPESLRTTGREALLQSRPKYKNRTGSKGKGKGKAPVRDWEAFEDDDPGDDEDEDDSIHHATTNGHKSMNRSLKGKGVARNLGADGFGDPSKNDEEELYG